LPSKPTLNVSLTDELCGFIAHQVETGRFQTASEVVRAALRLLEREAVASYPPDRPTSKSIPDVGSATPAVT
jgi:antitoxin ParD1/3/4